MQFTLLLYLGSLLSNSSLVIWRGSIFEKKKRRCLKSNPLFNPSHFSPLPTEIVCQRNFGSTLISNSSQVGRISLPATLSDPQWIGLLATRMVTTVLIGKYRKHLKSFSMNVILRPVFVWQFLFSFQDNIVLLSGIPFALARARNLRYFKYGNISQISHRPIQNVSKLFFTGTHRSDIQGVLHKDRYVRVN